MKMKLKVNTAHLYLFIYFCLHILSKKKLIVEINVVNPDF